jgi:hypothetical protein
MSQAAQPQVVLKYLFGVHYKDGTEFFQTPEDVSTTNSLKSAYYDVRQEDIELFQLNGEGATYLVDLRDGHFEIDGVPFYAQIPPEGSELRLIYFRRHRHHFNIGMDEVKHEIEYHFGWQTTHEGKNYQQTLILT